MMRQIASSQKTNQFILGGRLLKVVPPANEQYRSEKELDENDAMMRHPPQYLEVTKHEAAYRQITRGMEAFWKGDYDISITLALAAEGMAMPSDSGLFANMVDRRPDGFTKQQWVSIVNCERDWLKHPTTFVLGDAAKFDWDDAGYAISRALTRWPDWTPIMHEFKDWYVNYIRYHPKRSI